MVNQETVERQLSGKSQKTRAKPNFAAEGEFTKNGKRYVRIVGHDHVRDLIIPSRAPNVNETFICPDDLKKLTELPVSDSCIQK